MKKMSMQALAIAACSFLFACPMLAATRAPAKTTAKTAAKAANSAMAPRGVWPAETMSATIVNIDPARRLLIVKGPNGTPFDMVVTASTRIESGSHRLHLGDLQSDANKPVTVRFVPERSGDIARSLRLAG